MIKSKEIGIIILAGIVIALTLSVMKSLTIFVYALVSMLIILIINISAKKFASYYFDSEIQVKLWEIQRYGFKPQKRFKRLFPAGIFFPIIFTAISLGYVTWFAPLVFDVKAKVHRAAKRHGLYSFLEMTESHIGLIAAAGISANLIIAVIGYLIGFPYFARLNLYFAFFNMFPISDIDGNKIFFGSLVLWSFLAAITLIGMFYALLLV